MMNIKGCVISFLLFKKIWSGKNDYLCQCTGDALNLKIISYLPDI